ncbi:hypothetical protein BDV96DRAFT_641870 [Lophiotrema nucula]|uniref:Uncharacterized protein n=1 Tax=Lophiotrema nucula TaxID=690887 RepID=A0A6A5ZLG5_9PLEO|nr:hypothetical protein BDV96DRAFT_641870 [Lophiotrema nucula]
MPSANGKKTETSSKDETLMKKVTSILKRKDKTSDTSSWRDSVEEHLKCLRTACGHEVEWKLRDLSIKGTERGPYYGVLFISNYINQRRATITTPQRNEKWEVCRDIIQKIEYELDFYATSLRFGKICKSVWGWADDVRTEVQESPATQTSVTEAVYRNFNLVKITVKVAGEDVAVSPSKDGYGPRLAAIKQLYSELEDLYKDKKEKDTLRKPKEGPSDILGFLSTPDTQAC